MPTYTGYLFSDGPNGVAQSSTRPLWLDSNNPYFPVGRGWVPDNALNESLVTGNDTPARINKTVSGFYAGGYSDIFYNRILIEPSKISFSSISSTQVREFLVWNGYFVGQALNNIGITGTGAEGVAIAGDIPPPNQNFLALEEKTFTVTVNGEGTATVDVNVNFSFIGLPDTTLEVSGIRVITLPYLNSSPMTEELSWLTDVVTSRNGAEQRVRLRSAPRQRFKTRFRLSGPDLYNVENIIYGWRGKLFAITSWHESVYPGEIASGESTINMETRYGEFQVGGSVMIWESPTKNEVFAINAITNSSISFAQGIINSYTNPVVAPVKTAYMTRSPTRQTNAVNGFIEMDWEVTDNVALSPIVPDQTYNDVEFYSERPLKDPNFVSDSYIQAVDVVDFDTGIIELIAPWVNTKIERSYKIVNDSQEQTWNFRKWLHTRAGKAIPFYMPTFEPNMKLLTTGTLTSFIDVSDISQQGLGAARVTLGFLLKSGTWLLREITSKTQSPTYVTLGLSAPLDIQSTEIESICYVGLKRLSSDRITIEHLSNNVSRVKVSITETNP